MEKKILFVHCFNFIFLFFRSGAQRRGFFEVKRTSSILSSQEWNEKCIKTYIFEGNVQIHSDMVWFKKNEIEKYTDLFVTVLILNCCF